MANAIILAAGMGTRLGAHTKDLPKGMLSFMGRSLIERSVETLRAAGITDITIVRGHHPEKIAIPGVTYRENPDYATTNMVETLLCARDAMTGRQDATMVCYADIVYEPRLLTAALAAPGDISVVCDKDYLPYWQARLDKWESDMESFRYDTSSERVIELGSTGCGVDAAPARYVGLIKLTPAGVARFLETYDRLRAAHWDDNARWRHSRSFRTAYMTCMLQELIDAGIEVRAVPVERGWLEFDTVEDYEKALKWAREGTLEQFIRLDDTTYDDRTYDNTNDNTTHDDGDER